MNKCIKSFLFATLILISGCSKKGIDDQITSKKASSAAIPSVNFNWETEDYMPGMVNNNRVLVPWASGSNRSYPDHFIGDHRKIEGWELVYNTFGLPQHSGPFVFALYNKYRGTLRIYSYIPPGLSIPSFYAQHALELPMGIDSKMLNFSTRGKINIDSSDIRSNQIQPYKTAATGNWYGAEFDIGYDPQIANKEATLSAFKFETNSVNIQNVELNGVSSSTVNGTISNSASSSLGSMLFNKVQSGVISIGSLAALNSFGFTGALQTSLKNAFTSAQSGSLNGLMNAVLGLGGGSSGTTYRVKLNIKSDHKFTGSIQETFNIHNISLALPGTKNMQNVQGVIPYYNSVMGVFNLSQKPLVKGAYSVTTFRGKNGTSEVRVYRAPFTIDQSKISPVWNPAIINASSSGAHIANYKMEVFTYVIAENDLWHNEIEDALPAGYQVFEFEGRKAAIVPPGTPLPQENRYYAGRETGDGEYYLRKGYGYGTYGKEMQNEFIRVSFDVVPNNGDPSTKVVKSFSLIWDGIVTQ